MTEIVKEAYKLAEKELREKEKMRIKEVVKATLEKLRKKEIEKHSIEEEVKILRKDIEDLKIGRLDKIKERQDIDVKAREVSVIIVKEKVIEKQVPLWYIPWIIEIKQPYTPTYPYWTSPTNALVNTTTSDTVYLSNLTFTTTNSDTHMFSSGTYQLTDGTIKHI